jgi:hypothetical protein
MPGVATTMSDVSTNSTLTPASWHNNAVGRAVHDSLPSCRASSVAGRRQDYARPRKNGRASLKQSPYGAVPAEGVEGAAR